MEFKIKMSDNQFSNKSISMIADIEGDFTDMINTEMPSELPILPVRNIVLFPGVVWPILLGRASSMKLARQAEKNGEVIGVVCQRDPDIEVPTYDDLYEYGVSAKIVKQFTLPGGNTTVISAKVPLSNMFGYATDLRSGTQGRAVYTMQFDSYEPVPKSVRDDIVAKNGGSAS